MFKVDAGNSASPGAPDFLIMIPSSPLANTAWYPHHSQLEWPGTKFPPSNLQCFRASDAQSVRVRYTNQTKHAFPLRVAYVYRPKFIKIQYPAPGPDRDPEFNVFLYLINIWWITARSIYYIYKCKYRYSNIRSIFDPYAVTDTDTDAGYRYKYGSRFNVYSMHIWFIFDTGTHADR